MDEEDRDQCDRSMMHLRFADKRSEDSIETNPVLLVTRARLV